MSIALNGYLDTSAWGERGGCSMLGMASDSSVDLTASDFITGLEANVVGRLGGRLRHFRVLITEEGLVLHGQVQSYYAKQLAQHAVMGATTLPIVSNDIQVL